MLRDFDFDFPSLELAVYEQLAKFLDVDESKLRHREVPPRKPRSKIPVTEDDDVDLPTRVQ